MAVGVGDTGLWVALWGLLVTLRMKEQGPHYCPVLLILRNHHLGEQSQRTFLPSLLLNPHLLSLASEESSMCPRGQVRSQILLLLQSGHGFQRI